MKNYSITYRGEFSAEVKAKNIEEAIKKFEDNKYKITCCDALWPDFFKIDLEDNEGNIIKEDIS